MKWILLACLSFVAISTVASDSRCIRQNGKCVDWRYNVCPGGVARGMCSGDSNRRCCLYCSSTCEWSETNWDSCCDSRCKNAGGSCQVDSNYCSGTYSSGLCAGPSARKCCKSSSSGVCPLVPYANTNIVGYNGLTIKIEPGFRSYMDQMNSWAISCSVTVYVTHAFRLDGQNLGNTVVPPATTSNHLVGHAIDMNLQTPSGWCNSKCLQGQKNSKANCFINKVRNGGLRWGGDFGTPDSVHIDDGLNRNNKSKWNNLYYLLQRVCK